MGTWGTGLFSSDMARDIRDFYRERIEDRIEDAEATRLTPISSTLHRVKLISPRSLPSTRSDGKRLVSRESLRSLRDQAMTKRLGPVMALPGQRFRG